MSAKLSLTHHKIQSRDGFVLDALLLEPEQVKACVIINSATGVKKEFYKNFAEYLASNHYAVLLYDYRGIGQSRPSSLRGFHALNHEWGMKDMAAVLDWFSDRFAGKKIYAIGHSAGGQQMGFLDNYHKIHKAIAISSSTGYWWWLRSPYKYFTLFVWYVMVPITIPIVGYLPASWFGLGEDLPKGVALEWRSWCLSKNYYGNFLGKKIKSHYFTEIKFPILFLYPGDDTIATDLTVESLRQFYKSAPTTVEKLNPSNFPKGKIGHFGFFSRTFKDTLWPKVIAYWENE